MKTQLLPQPKIEFGKCPLCGKEIMKEEDKQAVKLESYADFWLSFGTGERMKMAICQDCKKTLTKKQAESILEVHKTFWLAGIEKTIDEKIEELSKKKIQDINYYKNLSLASYGLKEKDLE